MYEEACYGKSFLKQVIARIDFVAPIEDLEKTLPSKLGKALSTRFPISEPTDAFTHELQLQVGGEPHHQRKQFKQWNFFGKEREKQLTIAPSFVFVVVSEYSTYENLKADFSAVITDLEATFPNTHAARFGLRYINTIDIQGLTPPTVWDGYIAPALLGSTSFFPLEQLTRLVQIAELKFGDLALKFQFGMPNPDYPVPIKRPSFVLDFDAYIQSAHDLAGSLQYMDQAHRHIQDLFEKSITDRLRELMDVRNTTLR